MRFWIKPTNHLEKICLRHRCATGSRSRGVYPSVQKNARTGLGDWRHVVIDHDAPFIYVYTEHFLDVSPVSLPDFVLIDKPIVEARARIVDGDDARRESKIRHLRGGLALNAENGAQSKNSRRCFVIAFFLSRARQSDLAGNAAPPAEAGSSHDDWNWRSGSPPRGTLVAFEDRHHPVRRRPGIGRDDETLAAILQRILRFCCGGG